MVNKRFFKPLLPGFHSHLTIPVAFFSKNIQGRNEQTTAKLRSDASKITWEVKIEDGRRLTDGWKEFALAHDLRIGDMLIFRQERDMAFHVTMLGPSCCEIQYESCSEEENNLRNIPMKKKVKKNLIKVTESASLDPSFFVAKVTPSGLREDRLNLPKSFVRANGLETRCGEIVLINEKGTSWTLNLKRKNSGGTMSITRGWRRFCRVNGLRAGSYFTFKLIQRRGTLVLRLSLQFHKEFVTLTLKPFNLTNYTLYLPLHFTRRNGINEQTKMTLLDKNGVKWSTNLRSVKTSDKIRLVGGWQEFFEANCVEIGEPIILKLIWEGDKSCVLKFWSKVKQETR